MSTIHYFIVMTWFDLRSIALSSSTYYILRIYLVAEYPTCERRHKVHIHGIHRVLDLLTKRKTKFFTQKYFLYLNNVHETTTRWLKITTIEKYSATYQNVSNLYWPWFKQFIGLYPLTKIIQNYIHFATFFGLLASGQSLGFESSHNHVVVREKIFCSKKNNNWKNIL